MDDYLPIIYYDPKRSGGFGGVGRLYQDVKKEGKFKISRKEIKEWLMKQDAFTLHKPMRRHFKRNRVIVGGIDQQWQMDLADMQSMQKFNSLPTGPYKRKSLMIYDFAGSYRQLGACYVDENTTIRFSEKLYPNS